MGWVVGVVCCCVFTLRLCFGGSTPPYLFDLGGSSWTVYNETSPKYASTVPGTVHTDLLNAGVIDDPYYRFNDVDYRWIGLSDWVFERTFTPPAALLKYKKIILVCYGLDTAATVVLNGVTLGTANNMFRRWTFDVTSYLSSSSNTLSLAFQSAATYADTQASNYPYEVPANTNPSGEDNRNFIRKEQCSFSWDWGPCFIPSGIWQPIHLVGFSDAFISDTTAYPTPTSGLTQWTVNINVFLQSRSSTSGTVNVDIPALSTSTSKSVSLVTGENKVSLTMTVSNPQLWWPNGVGEDTRTLYNLQTSFTSSDGETSSYSQNIGFRKLELVQEPYSDTIGNSFYFRVNDFTFFAKGSNWIPADSFEPRITTDMLDTLLTSASEAHMNMLRNWGGGIYQQDSFYDLADQLGILIWEDIMFACAMYPRDKTFLLNVANEVQYQTRRTMSHPSLLLWSGNNENEAALRWYPATLTHEQRYTVDYSVLYFNTVRTAIVSEDPWHPFLSSSPSNGALVDSKELFVGRWGDPGSENYGDVHYYNYIEDCWKTWHFPKPRFASEFGYQSFPSLETWEPVTVRTDLHYESELMRHRQHHDTGNLELQEQVEMHFVWPNNTNSVTQFDDICYVTQVTQALCVKAETEHYRRHQSINSIYTMGALYWQLNDIWQGPTWASIEYGGKWKLLHNYAKDFFAPILVSSYEVDGKYLVYVNNDTPDSIICYVTISFIGWIDGQTKYKHSTDLFTVTTASSLLIFEGYISEMTGGLALNEGVFTLTLKNVNDSVISSNQFYPSDLKSAPLQKAVVTTAISMISDFSASVNLTTTAVAPFVTLTAYGMTGGHFSSNGFLMLPGTMTTVTFDSKQSFTLNQLNVALGTEQSVSQTLLANSSSTAWTAVLITISPISMTMAQHYLKRSSLKTPFVCFPPSRCIGTRMLTIESSAESSVTTDAAPPNVSSTRARVGKFSFSDGGFIDTPGVATSTKKCAIPFLTPDLTSGVPAQCLSIPLSDIAENELTIRQWAIHNTRRPSSVDSAADSASTSSCTTPSSAVQCRPNGGVRALFCLKPSSPLYLSARTTACLAATGASPKGVLLDTKSGRKIITPTAYMELAHAAGVNLLDSLFVDLTLDSSPSKSQKNDEKGLKWLDECIALNTGPGGPVMSGVIQGGVNLQSRIRNASEVAKRNLPAYSIAGLGLGEDVRQRGEIVDVVVKTMPAQCLRVIHGIGIPEEVLDLVQRGVDLFTNNYASYMASWGYALIFHVGTSEPSKPSTLDKHKINLNDNMYFMDFQPFVVGCTCYACRTYTRAYVHHLLLTHEMLANILLSLHNNFHYLRFFEDIRRHISTGTFQTYCHDIWGVDF
ncbi:Mannosidase, beta A, lysosomal [Pelomyxa schiedti]|nr:Mannosidase, beta A, lysosomal [Pelomyxa schiedti]